MIRITINTENDSFQDETVTHNFRKRAELAQILRKHARRLERGEAIGFKVTDYNGQTVGDIQLTEPDIDLS